jgi:hypothetical protein
LTSDLILDAFAIVNSQLLVGINALLIEEKPQRGIVAILVDVTFHMADLLPRA